jgi:hypothetical protein
MTQRQTARSIRSRLRRTATRALLAALTLGVLSMAACSLEVTDPDIILPEDVQSAAGANGVRLGALARFDSATTGAESLFLLGGLFADEFNNGDSFIARQEIDQRVITPQNNFLTDANRTLHRTRWSAEQALQLMAVYVPTAPAWQVGEMHFVQGFLVNLLAEHYCDGLVFSRVVEGREEYGAPLTRDSAFARALTHTDAGLALPFGSDTASVRVRNALRVTRGRILLNVGRSADAATAVAGVPTSFRYTMRHSLTTNLNAFWSFNNNARRYSVSTAEGTNGLNYATAGDPRVPVCLGGDAACKAIGDSVNRRDDQGTPLYVQMLWTTRESPVTIINGIEARLIEAEAQLPSGAATLAALNALRDDSVNNGGFRLPALADPGTLAGYQDLLFRERAFWLFGRGHRVGDMRRLIRQYNRLENTVFPTGAWHKGGNYGTDVNFPIPLAEANNPNVPQGQTCMNRDP